MAQRGDAIKCLNCGRLLLPTEGMTYARSIFRYMILPMIMITLVMCATWLVCVGIGR
jgi:hypothetical protein